MNIKKINTAKLIVYFFAFAIVFLYLASLRSILPLENENTPLMIGIVTASALMSIQGLMTLVWMLYAWEDPEEYQKNLAPKTYEYPSITFSIIVPARHEANVIGQTISAINSLAYPKELYEVLIVCRDDDPNTINASLHAIETLNIPNIRVETLNSGPYCKPNHLNVGLSRSLGEYILILDAEDEPEYNLLNVANTIIIREKPHVLQGGVQLMNYGSKWFSTLNVLEYYFWFKSALHLFSKLGVIPLGGNTVFFQRKALEQINGWDEGCLTEDADIGIKLSALDAKIRIFYEPSLTTKEETPDSLKTFIKQRTRWSQGFLQVLFKFGWWDFRGISRKIIAIYVLLWPQIQALNFVFVVLFPFFMTIKMPIIATLTVFMPLALLSVQFSTFLIGFHMFVRDYNLKDNPINYIKIAFTYIPYQLFLLSYCSFRALFRQISGINNWEKTTHKNLHRNETLSEVIYETR